MPYGHKDTQRNTPFDSFHRNNFINRQAISMPSRQSELQREKDFLFGPWEERARRSEFEPSQKYIDMALLDYLLNGNKIKGLSPIPADIISKPGKTGEGISSSSNIFC